MSSDDGEHDTALTGKHMPTDCTKEQVLAAKVAAGESVVKAAESVGWSVSRAYRITSTPDFKRQVAEIRTQAVSAAVGSLTEAAKEAVDALRAALKSEKTNDQLAAAKAILSALGPITELGEIRARLDAIEGRQMRVAG